MSIQSILNNPEKLHAVTKAAFDSVDADKSGFLEINELEEVMKSVAKDIGIDSPSQNEVKDVLSELDTNNDGKLSLEEFKTLIVQVLTMMAQNE